MTDSSSKRKRPRMVAALMDTFGLTAGMAFGVFIFICVVGLLAAVWVFLSAPPRSVTVITGPADSSFQRYADRYAKFMAEHGVQLKIVPSGGSMENLQKLQDPKSGIDIAFIQGGIIQAQAYNDALAKAAAAKQPPPSVSQISVPRPKGLESLGSIAYQPIWVFYRSDAPMQRLSELAGKRVAIGKIGSGTFMLASTILQANGITAENATLVQDDASTAAAGLMKGKYDAIFLMGDSAPTSVLRSMIREPGIRIYDFIQADAYVRRYNYLNRMRLPQGSFDIGQNLPAQDISVVGPTVELVARKGLNPAIVQLLIEAAREVHGNASILQRQGEFPAPLEHEFTISEDARRYYKSGKGFLASAVDNIWLASLISRIAVAFVPVFLVLIPVLRFLPVAYRLRNHLRIYRCYRPLLNLEREVSGPLSHERAQALLGRLAEVEREVDRLKVPASFGEQYYELRQHVLFVRRRLKVAAATAERTGGERAEAGTEGTSPLRT